LLPASEQTKPEEDRPYLSPIIEAIEAENKERADLEAMIVQKK
jgi:ubiquinol-cytochrome c reductase subunit 7